MIGVEQIRVLEDRIEKALAFIEGLRADNTTLRAKAEESEEARGRADDRAAAAESRVRELEEAIAAFKRDQSRIEEGILHALEKLDAFEDLVLRGSPVAAEAAPPSVPRAEPAVAKTPSRVESPASADLALEGMEPEVELPEMSAPEPIPAAAAAVSEGSEKPRHAERAEVPEPATPQPEPSRPASPQPAADELEIF